MKKSEDMIRDQVRILYLLFVWFLYTQYILAGYNVRCLDVPNCVPMHVQRYKSQHIQIKTPGKIPLNFHCILEVPGVSHTF